MRLSECRMMLASTMLSVSGVLPLFRLNPERMDGVNGAFGWKLAYKQKATDTTSETKSR